MDVEEQVGTSHAYIEGRRPSVSLKWSTMPSLTLYVTNLEWVKSSLFTVESIGECGVRESCISASRSRGLYRRVRRDRRRVNFSMGLRILRGRAATQIGFVHHFEIPSKLTMRRPISTFSAPREIETVAEHPQGPGRSWQPLKIYFPSCRCSVLLADIGMLFWF